MEASGQLHAPPCLTPRGKILRCPFVRRVSEPHRRSGRDGGEKNSTIAPDRNRTPLVQLVA